MFRSIANARDRTQVEFITTHYLQHWPRLSFCVTWPGTDDPDASYYAEFPRPSPRCRDCRPRAVQWSRCLRKVSGWRSLRAAYICISRMSVLSRKVSRDCIQRSRYLCSSRDVWLPFSKDPGDELANVMSCIPVQLTQHTRRCAERKPRERSVDLHRLRAEQNEQVRLPFELNLGVDRSEIVRGPIGFIDNGFP
jgi:hypothetical protein